ncbi:hypothetical protein [Sphingorhabdus sp.]|uniref:hypothetical protein n=1 Tax=Sphingorhabdus sp. TaxID=1902408 RepID=UPI003983D241
MTLKMMISVLALTLSTVAMAAEVAKPDAKMECCCCKKEQQGKMDCCKDKAKDSEKAGHEGHDMDGMNHK